MTAPRLWIAALLLGALAACIPLFSWPDLPRSDKTVIEEETQMSYFAPFLGPGPNGGRAIMLHFWDSKALFTDEGDTTRLDELSARVDAICAAEWFAAEIAFVGRQFKLESPPKAVGVKILWESGPQYIGGAPNNDRRTQAYNRFFKVSSEFTCADALDTGAGFESRRRFTEFTE